MRVLIVDDEAPARAKLARMLAAHPDVALVGEAADGATALGLARERRPDVVFLDVQMPEVDGFEVAASLPTATSTTGSSPTVPALVFVTAFDRHALRAFDAQAVDYLLKPVDPERLARTLQRLRGSISQPVASRLAPVTRQLVISERGRLQVVRCAEIEWLEAADNYVELHLAGGRSALIRRPFTALLDELGPAFVRLHRSTATALDRIVDVRSRANGDALVQLRSGAELPCSRAHRALLLERLAPPPGAGSSR